MQPIEAILFEPVGCLAEFPPEPFDKIAARNKPSRSGSRSYWHLLNLMEASGQGSVEDLEIQAVAGASVYDDVLPALSELKAMGVKVSIASSLSNAALARFLEIGGLTKMFDEVWGRDNSGGIKAVPLTRAARNPVNTMFLTDTAEGIKVAKSVGVHAVLMMNDPDEARRLTLLGPAGGIVSLHELPDFVRLVLAENARAVS